MDGLIEEIRAELPDPVPEGQQFTDLDDQVPPPLSLPADQWVEILNDAKDEFEVDGASAVFSTWRVEEDDPLDIGDIEIADGMHARAGRLALMADVSATQLMRSQRAILFWDSSFSVRKMMTWSLKTSLIQSGLRERNARGSSRSLGTQKGRKENPQKLTQLSSRSHPRHLVGKRSAQKDTIIDITSDSQVNSNYPYSWSPASLTFNNYFLLFSYLYIT